VYAIEQGEVIESVKKIGKANGLEATEVGLLDFTIGVSERFLWWQAEFHHVKMFIVALVQSEEIYSKVNFWNEDVLSRRPKTELLGL